MIEPSPNTAQPGTELEADTLPGAEHDGRPGTDGATAASDRGFELSLRLLTVVVLVALVGSAVLLAYRLIAPRLEETAGGPVRVTAAHPRPAPSADSANPANGDQVLMDPGHVFRCEEQGRVTFSDQACTNSAKARN